MRQQIRKNVFETNSSSQHTISIMKSDVYDKWVTGKIAVRFFETEDSECEDCWRNFWSDQMFFETCSIEEKHLKNLELISEILVRMKNDHDLEISELNKRNNPKSHKKTLELYGYKVDDEWIRRVVETYMDDVKKFQNYPDTFNNADLFYNNLYMTYDECLDALDNIDCYSPFKHKKDDIIIFGTYFHG